MGPADQLSLTGFCRQARQTALLSDSVACIREQCTAGRPFSPNTLLTPFEEKCKFSLDDLADARGLAAQKSAPSSSADGDLAVRVPTTATPSSSARDAAATTPTTYIGIATNVDGKEETYTVPALLVATGTIYGKPITGVQGSATPMSTVTLPWPTLPVGWFSLSQSQETTRVSSVVQAPTTTTSAAAAGAPTSTGGQNDENTSTGGTILDTSDGRKHGAASSLGLMVVLVVGVLWF
ncbi:MAG: hypothetical protein LQ346_004967 [Caloplaca aetnensis]|nr:MAG: hypothetical protein LQ346_004967 [Caloplaca aetnensis]